MTTKDGVVTLMGHVDTYAQTGVSNQITIKPRVDAGVIKDDIMIALNRSWLCPEKTDVTARDGKVTLTGTVDYWDVRAFAGTTAWAAPGVTSVTHDIRVYRRHRNRARSGVAGPDARGHGAWCASRPE